MPNAKTWFFEQLGGEKKSIELSGWQAPHGRPRQKPVVTDGVEIRKTEVYYPGDDRGPTLHLFGRKYTQWELEGRFRDRSDGVGFAVAMTERVKKFVGDQQRCRISWGDILSVEGFLDKFEPGRESEGEVAWKLTASIYVDLFAKRTRKPKQQKTIGLAAQLAKLDLEQALPGVPHTPTASIFDGLDSILGLPANVSGAFVESMDGIVDIFTSTAGAFQKAAGGISDVEKATFASLNRLASVSNQLQGAAGALRETFTNADADAVLLRERATENARLWKGQSATESALADLVGELADVRVAVALVKRGVGTGSVVAVQGDTWESLSTKAYGSPDRAADLRAANDIPAGAYPVPGTEYIVPT